MLELQKMATATSADAVILTLTSTLSVKHRRKTRALAFSSQLPQIQGCWPLSSMPKAFLSSCSTAEQSQARRAFSDDLNSSLLEG